MLRFYLIILSLLVVLATISESVHASGSCQLIANGGSICTLPSGQLTIDKSVQNPQTKIYEAVLPESQYIFSQGEHIAFQIKLSNSGNAVSNITIEDTLPVNLDFASGDGSFDANKHILTIKLNQLSGKGIATYNYDAVVNTKSLPQNQSTACLINQVSVATTSFIFFTSTESQNSATFCVKAVQKSIPPQPASNAGQVPTTTGGMRVIYVTPGQIHTQKSAGSAKKQPMFSSPKLTQSPPTGPDLLSLLALPAFAYAGKKLQAKAKQKITRTRTS